MILARRRVRHDGVGDAAVGDLVLAHLHRHGRHRRHRLDAVDLSFRKLLDESEDSVELAAKMLDLVLGNSEARQMRYAADGTASTDIAAAQASSVRRENFAIAARSFRYRSFRYSRQ